MTFPSCGLNISSLALSIYRTKIVAGFYWIYKRSLISKLFSYGDFLFLLACTSSSLNSISSLCKPLDFRSRDWGSAPRWAAFVDFFIAARARYAVVTGAHRRVGTTYAQLIAALAAANRHGTYPEVSTC
jgi:hypothetical protein